MNLRRYLVFAMLLVFAMQAQGEPPPTETKHVSGNVHLITSGAANGNIAVAVGDEGLFVVDASVARLAEPIRAALRQLSDKPVRYLVDTHYHGDHTTGNIGFAGAVIVAHDNVRKRLASSGFGGNFATFRFPYSPLAPQALPTVTFQQSLTIRLNDEDIRIVHFGPAHTDGDAIVYFPKANVAALGDLFTDYGFPDIDVAGGADTEGWIAALDEIARMLPADVRIIPGHGPISTLADVRKLSDMLRGTLDTVKRAREGGKSAAQMKQDRILAPWAQWAGFFNADVYLDMLYNDVVDTTAWPAQQQ